MRYFNEEESIAKEKKVYDTSQLPPNYAWYATGVQEEWKKLDSCQYCQWFSECLLYGEMIACIYQDNLNIRIYRDITCLPDVLFGWRDVVWGWVVNITLVGYQLVHLNDLHCVYLSSMSKVRIIYALGNTWGIDWFMNFRTPSFLNPSIL